MSPRFASLSVGLATLICTTQAQAGTATASLSVTATVSGNCTISTTAVAFGTYDPIVVNATNPADNQGGVSIACTKGVAAPIGLDLGANATGSTRRMTNGTDFLTYELYQDNARTTVWGNASGAQLTPSAAPSNAARAFTVYGRVPGGQNISAGSFTDTVVATVNF